MGEGSVSVEAAKGYARLLGDSDRRKSSSGKLPEREEQKERRKRNRPGTAASAHTRER